MLLIFPLEVVQVFCFSFDKFELLILGVLKKFVKLGHLSLVMWYYFLLFKSFFFWWIWHFFQFFLSFGSFHLVYLLKARMKLNGQMWLDEMEQRNSEKNQTFLVVNDKCFFFYLLTFNSRADILTRYTFHEVRYFFYI